jgi:hypothetical protein
MVIAVAAVVILHPARARGEFLHFTADPSASDISATVLEPMSSFRGNVIGKFRVVSGKFGCSPERSQATRQVRRGPRA